MLTIRKITSSPGSQGPPEIITRSFSSSMISINFIDVSPWFMGSFSTPVWPDLTTGDLFVILELNILLSFPLNSSY